MTLIVMIALQGVDSLFLSSLLLAPVYGGCGLHVLATAVRRSGVFHLNPSAERSRLIN